VHDEAVTLGTDRLPIGVLQHAGRVDRDVTLGIAEHREDVRGRRGDDSLNLDTFAHRHILTRMGWHPGQCSVSVFLSFP
jgi:hypothetical protein